ncbi:hypothetical protein Esti_000740 [Eimeria stiedai]
MEDAAAVGAPSGWGPPTTASSFLLQAVACPAPWAPDYVPAGIRATFVAAGFPTRKPPLVVPLGAPLNDVIGALREVLAYCTLTAEDAQYKSILTFGSYDKFEKPNLPELLACIVLIALGPLTSQQLHLFIEDRLRSAGGLSPPTGFLFFWRVFTRVFAPLSLCSFGYLSLCCSAVSTPLAVAAALAAGFFLSFPSVSPEALSPWVGAFLVPCYAFTFGLNVYCVVGAQMLFCLLTKLTCKSFCLLIMCCFCSYFVPFADHRTMQMIVTCIAILAVDFLTFPRRYCKSVNSGVTLMDLGVGGIIFTSGMVSRHAKGTHKTSEPLLSAVARAASQSSVLGLFGLLRLIFMSLTDLHVSPSEYGLHWNFYMTLMVVCALVFEASVQLALLHKIFAGYQAVISFFDLEEWMMEGPRTNFFSANREGILGSFGFLCVFLMAVSLGHFFVTHAPLNEATKSEHLSFTFLGIGLMLQEWFGLLPRRRFVNLSWVAFVTGIEVFAVAASTTTDALAARVSPQWSLRGTNENQLIIFLIANVCVGIVNMSLRCLLQPAVAVWAILTAYVSLLFVCGHLLGRSGRRIKII